MADFFLTGKENSQWYESKCWVKVPKVDSSCLIAVAVDIMPRMANSISSDSETVSFSEKMRPVRIPSIACNALILFRELGVQKVLGVKNQSKGKVNSFVDNNNNNFFVYSLKFWIIKEA